MSAALRASTARVPFTHTAAAILVATGTVSAFEPVLLPVVAGVEIANGTALASQYVMDTIDLKDVIYDVHDEAIDRLNMLSELDHDHDGEGAAAPNLDSIRVADALIRSIPFQAPDFNVGLSSEGFAVIEFKDAGEFGQIILKPDRTAEFYYAKPGRPSQSFEGGLNDPDVRNAFQRSFGFALNV